MAFKSICTGAEKLAIWPYVLHHGNRWTSSWGNELWHIFAEQWQKLITGEQSKIHSPFLAAGDILGNNHESCNTAQRKCNCAVRYLERFGATHANTERWLNIILLSRLEAANIRNTDSSNCWRAGEKKFSFTAEVTEMFQFICLRLWWQEKAKGNEDKHKRKKGLTVRPSTALVCLSKHDQTYLEARGLHNYGTPALKVRAHTSFVCGILFQNGQTTKQRHRDMDSTPAKMFTYRLSMRASSDQHMNTEFEMLNLEHFPTPKRLNRSIVNDYQNVIKWLLWNGCRLV